MSKSRNVVLLESLKSMIPECPRWYEDTYGFFTSSYRVMASINALVGVTEKDDPSTHLYCMALLSNLLMPVTIRDDDVEFFETQKIRANNTAGKLYVGDREITNMDELVAYVRDIRVRMCAVPCDLITYIAYGVFFRMIQAKTVTAREVETLILRVIDLINTV